MLLLFNSLLLGGTFTLPQDDPAPQQIYGSGKRAPRVDDADLLDQVRDKWDRIEAAQRRLAEPAEPEPAPRQDVPPAIESEIVVAEPAPVIDPELAQRMRLSMPAGASALPIQSLGSSALAAEYMIRSAIERDDEDALLIILSRL